MIEAEEGRFHSIGQKDIEYGNPGIDVGVLPIARSILEHCRVQGKQKKGNDPWQHCGQAIDKGLLK